jgi:hypothetical protein
MVKNSSEQNDKNGQSIEILNCLLPSEASSNSFGLNADKTSNSSSSSTDETANLTVKPRRDITLPCGKRKWIRTVPKKKNEEKIKNLAKMLKNTVIGNTVLVKVDLMIQKNTPHGEKLF